MSVPYSPLEIVKMQTMAAATWARVEGEVIIPPGVEAISIAPSSVLPRLAVNGIPLSAGDVYRVQPSKGTQGARVESVPALQYTSVAATLRYGLALWRTPPIAAPRLGPIMRYLTGTVTSSETAIADLYPGGGRKAKLWIRETGGVNAMIARIRSVLPGPESTTDTFSEFSVTIAAGDVTSIVVEEELGLYYLTLQGSGGNADYRVGIETAENVD